MSEAKSGAGLTYSRISLRYVSAYFAAGDIAGGTAGGPLAGGSL
jgi:hypothetical protein